MKCTLIPSTKLGMFSFYLILAVLIMFLVVFYTTNSIYRDTPAGITISQDIRTRPGVSLPMITGLVFALLSFCIGVFSVLKKKESSILVFISILLGSFIMFIFIGELIYPH